MNNTWSDYFGNYFTATDIVKEVESSNLDMETWLCESFREIFPNAEDEPNFTELVKEIWSDYKQANGIKDLYINFNNGRGNNHEGTLESAEEEADEEASYTQQPITIEDENGNELARRPWYGVEPDEEEQEGDIIQFGSYGFYGPWQEA